MAEQIPGIEMDFGGGRKFVIPPLTLGALQRMQGALESLSGASSLTPAAINTVIEATLSALKRNYPTMTAEEVGELVDVSNMQDVISTVLDVAGLKRKAAEEEAKNRLAQPVQTSAQTGLGS